MNYLNIINARALENGIYEDVKMYIRNKIYKFQGIQINEYNGLKVDGEVYYEFTTESGKVLRMNKETILNLGFKIISEKSMPIVKPLKEVACSK